MQCYYLVEHYPDFLMAKLDVKQDALESELTNYALGKEGASNTKERANPRVYKLVRVSVIF